MLLPTRHEVLAPGMHRFVFPSESRPGVEHVLTVDFHDEGAGHLMCLCEAGLFGRFCKHQRLLVLGLAETARLEEEADAMRQARRRARSGKSARDGRGAHDGRDARAGTAPSQ